MTKFRTIVADPPWPFEWRGGPGGRRAHQTDAGYEPMPLEAIHALPVNALVDDDAVLLLWVTPQLYREGIGVAVARSWGFFNFPGEFIWRKPNFGAGRWPRSGHEPCLVATRGRPLPIPRLDVHSVQTWNQNYSNNGGKRHSAKPEGFYDLVERDCPAPYLELFARRGRLGWDYAGDESLSTIEINGLAA